MKNASLAPLCATYFFALTHVKMSIWRDSFWNGDSSLYLFFAFDLHKIYTSKHMISIDQLFFSSKDLKVNVF